MNFRFAFVGSQARQYVWKFHCSFSWNDNGQLLSHTISLSFRCHGISSLSLTATFLSLSSHWDSQIVFNLPEWDNANIASHSLHGSGRQGKSITSVIFGWQLGQFASDQQGTSSDINGSHWVQYSLVHFHISKYPQVSNHNACRLSPLLRLSVTTFILSHPYFIIYAS